MRTPVVVAVVLLCCSTATPLCAANRLSTAKLGEMAQGQTGSESGEMPHMDHQAKHHGIFFMAPDNIHHIEGTLLPSNNFRLYLYDEYTKPLSGERVRKTKAYLTVMGADPSALRKVELTASGETLDATLGKDLKLPAVLKLTVFFGDLPSGNKPEEFSFHFRRYNAAQAGEEASHSAHGSSDMKMSHPM